MAMGCKSRVYRGRIITTMETVLLHVGVDKKMLLHSNGDLQISTDAMVMDVRNMWEVSMEGSHRSAAY
jgi:hypothetical protein